MDKHPQVRRFDQSFIFHMIRDFFLVLIVVVCVELGIRFIIILYEFEHHDKFIAELTAEKLASDLKSIMLNSGGPVAARSIYPILKRNHKELGLEIAIIPTALTISSIETIFSFTPKGIPPEWPEGKHHEYTVRLTAEQFCLNCHIDGKIGDLLGQVVVRSYLSEKIDHWWEEVRLASLLGMFNIILHTIVLFLLLKIRMEPLISLHSTVSTLAKGVIDLSFRANVKTHDEFGELALDLNHFLDRITQIVEDLRDIIDNVISVNSELTPLSLQISQQIEATHDHTQKVVKYTLERNSSYPEFSNENLDTIDKILAVLEVANPDQQINDELKVKAYLVLTNFRDMILQAQEIFQHFDQLSGSLTDLSDEVHGLTRLIAEMALLEEKMNTIIKLGEALLRRLSNKDSSK